MRFCSLTMACLSLLLAGCVGSGSSGDALATATASAFCDFMVFDPITGSVEMRADVPDLVTNPTYRSNVIVFRRIQGGEGVIGSNAQAETYHQPDDSNRYRTMTVAEHFLAVFELTNAQYDKLKGNPSVGDTFPKTGLAPAEVDTLLDGASARLRVRLRLPSADEWEHDCRAGAASLFSWGDQTNSVISSKYAITFLDDTTTAALVGSRLPNSFGIFDMHGNVWEMTGDEAGAFRWICGGSWRDSLLQARSANRAQLPVLIGHPLVGLRLVLSR